MTQLVNTILVVTIVSFFALSRLALGLDCQDDDFCFSRYGEFSACEDGKCICLDFYGLVGAKCVKVRLKLLRIIKLEKIFEILL